MGLKTKPLQQAGVEEKADIVKPLKELWERWKREVGENVKRILLTGQLALRDVMEALSIPIDQYEEVLKNTEPSSKPVGDRPLYFVAKHSTTRKSSHTASR